MEVLLDYDFPGNVRELKNIIERALIESGGADIQPEHIHLLQTTQPRIEERALVESDATDG